MSKTPEQHNQFSLSIRILAGGYLLYTAWDLRGAISENPLFLIAIVAFTVIGIALIVHSGWRLWKKDYDGAPGMEAADETAVSEASPEETPQDAQ